MISFDEGNENIIGRKLPKDEVPEKLKKNFEMVENVNLVQLEKEVI